MASTTDTSILRTLCNLRWLASAGQAVALLVANGLMKLQLPILPLCGGIAALIAFNCFAEIRFASNRETPSASVIFLHLTVDIVALAWVVFWSGGLTNPFASLFLIPIALAAITLPRFWAIATAVVSLVAYGLSVTFAPPLHYHGKEVFDLHLLGMEINFLLSALVVLYFAIRMTGQLRRRDRELAALRERFARNEGIIALAAHAASVAHELNTPLATMTLLAEDIAEQAQTRQLSEDAALLVDLLALCRDRVRTLATPEDTDLERIIGQWRLLRPDIELHRSGQLPPALRVEPAISHLLQTLLDNAADASRQTGILRVDLYLHYETEMLRGEIRDYGRGLDPNRSLLPATLFRSTKSDGLGIGLALSHATVERLGGDMTMTAAEGGGVRIRFNLPLPASGGST
ncbi:MAG: sensor histidine kinase [Xanthomonadaceae bacterium]|jgi:two-component system sensor histidine kinase RegB|nr:sensor histidine kinase [Xanthomonadaceae bacterium]